MTLGDSAVVKGGSDHAATLLENVDAIDQTVYLSLGIGTKEVMPMI